jgi:hypothetical protein
VIPYRPCRQKNPKEEEEEEEEEEKMNLSNQIPHWNLIKFWKQLAWVPELAAPVEIGS